MLCEIPVASPALGAMCPSSQTALGRNATRFDPHRREGAREDVVVAVVVETTAPRWGRGGSYLGTLHFLDGVHRVGRRVLRGGQREEAASMDFLDEADHLCGDVGLRRVTPPTRTSVRGCGFEKSHTSN